MITKKIDADVIIIPGGFSASRIRHLEERWEPEGKLVKKPEWLVRLAQQYRTLTVATVDQSVEAHKSSARYDLITHKTFYYSTTGPRNVLAGRWPGDSKSTTTSSLRSISHMSLPARTMVADKASSYIGILSTALM